MIPNKFITVLLLILPKKYAAKFVNGMNGNKVEFLPCFLDFYFILSNTRLRSYEKRDLGSIFVAKIEEPSTSSFLLLANSELGLDHQQSPSLVERCFFLFYLHDL